MQVLNSNDEQVSFVGLPFSMDGLPFSIVGLPF
jgi:hypothetical protein